jgi:hypothetical protein
VGGWEQVKQWRKQQQNVLPQPALPDYNNRAGPQQCVRKHFLLLSFLSQQKIILSSFEKKFFEVVNLSYQWIWHVRLSVET